MPISEVNNRIDSLYAEIGSLKKQIEIIINTQDDTQKKSENQKEENSERLIRIEAKGEYLDTRITETKQELTELRQEMRSGFSEMRDKLDNTLKWVIGICLTSVFGVAAIVIAVLIK